VYGGLWGLYEGALGMGYCSLKRRGPRGGLFYRGTRKMNGGLRNGSIFPCGSSFGGLPSGNPEGHREMGSEDGYVRSPGTLRDS
jgi:hypothetical protein